MYNGIGLTSVRGSGTNGYVQKNMAHVSRQRTARAKSVDSAADRGDDLKAPRQANTEILEHNRKRQVEVKVMELRVTLEDQGVAEEEIERKVEALRTSLLAKLPAAGAPGPSGAGGRAGETHSDAAAKERENAALKGALGIRSDYVGGTAFDRELQAQLKAERMAKREAEEEQRAAMEAELQRELAREEKEREKERAREEKKKRKEARREERADDKRRRKDERDSD